MPLPNVCSLQNQNFSTFPFSRLCPVGSYCVRIMISPLLHHHLRLLLSDSAPCSTRSASNGSGEKEKTLAMIKPDGGLANHTERIKKAIVESGFSIYAEMTTRLDEDRASSFYAEHTSKSFFPSLIKCMTSGPVLVMVLEKENAAADWHSLIGTTDAHKAKITNCHSIIATEKSCVHGSDSLVSALRGITFFFKEVLSGEAVTKNDEL